MTRNQMLARLRRVRAYLSRTDLSLLERCSAKMTERTLVEWLAA